MKEKIMFPYFIWQKPTRTDPIDRKKAAKLEDLFYAQYGRLSIKARVRNALEVFAERAKSIYNIEHREVLTVSSARVFGSSRKLVKKDQ
jgi:predicted nucleotidyltransferase